MRFAVNRYDTLLHGLEQCRLGFCRSPIDLIGNEEIRKNRTFHKGERTFLHVEYIRSCDVSGHQIRGELNS